MAGKKNKGVTEEDMMVDLTAEDEAKTSEQPVSEQKKEEPQEEPKGTIDVTKEDVKPENLLNEIQMVNLHTLRKVVEEDPDNAAFTAEKIISSMGRIATAQQRAAAELNKGEGNKELAKAIAQNNLGRRTRKRVDAKASDIQEEAKKTGGNPVKDRKVNFGNEISEQEVSTKVESVDFEVLEEAEQKAQDKARVNSSNKNNK